MFPLHLGYDGSKAFGAEVVDTLKVVQMLQLLYNVGVRVYGVCS